MFVDFSISTLLFCSMCGCGHIYSVTFSCGNNTFITIKCPCSSLAIFLVLMFTLYDVNIFAQLSFDLHFHGIAFSVYFQSTYVLFVLNNFS